MTALYDLAAVLDLEAQVIREELPSALPSALYFKNEVAQVLLQAWRSDPTDTRILTYTLPLIHALMVRHRQVVRRIGLPVGEVFNELVVVVADELKHYRPERGRLYTFLTMRIPSRLQNMATRGPRVHDDLDDMDVPQDDQAPHVLADFRTYLRRRWVTEGPTAKRILAALLSATSPADPTVIVRHSHLVARVVKLSGLPELVVGPYLSRLTAGYLAGGLAA